MARSSESFKEDRLWNTPPDADAPDDVKYRYQKELRRRWEAMQKPSDIMDFPMPTDDWWTHPFGIDSAIIARQQLKRMKRSTG
jgi:hypothetical protein